MRFSNEEKKLWLEDWQQSGKSAYGYAKANGINPQTFLNWAKARKKNKSCLVEVPARVIQSLDTSHEIFIEKGDIKIRVPLSIKIEELRAVIIALRGTT